MQWGHVPFSYVKKSVTTNNNLSSNLKNMSNCAFQWEISFSPDLLKPTEQIIFSKKSIKHSEVFSNSSGVIIGSKLTLDIRIKSAMAKVNKAIDPIRNFQHAVSRLFLVITTY